ncbi:MAG: C45 family autoproteolytic acyltransferase/hydrolase [Planctomycetota bacterium]|jgi:isopenicillin-N N-acyltransferase-like protein
MIDERNLRYPFYEAGGSAEELGRQHGEQARLRIVAFLGWLCESLKMSERDLAQRASRFRPLFKKWCPHLLTEIQGLARGAGINENLALACQLRGELAKQNPGGCTTFAATGPATADGSTLIGQNSDTDAEISEFAYVLHLIPDDRPELIIWTFGGMIGYHGLNEHGVAHFANSLGGGPDWQFALSHYPLKRMILEQKTLDDVRQLIRDVPVASSGNYMLCDGSGEIADIEVTPRGAIEIARPQSGTLAHTNHFLCGEHACEENWRQSLPDSYPRQLRAEAFLKERAGQLTLDDAKQLLADHEGYPVSICRHPHRGEGDAVLPNTGRTIAGLIAEPQHGRLQVCTGNPCERPFVAYELGRNGIG